MNENIKFFKKIINLKFAYFIYIMNKIYINKIIFK